MVERADAGLWKEQICDQENNPRKVMKNITNTQYECS
jgi:hypothetical protein